MWSYLNARPPRTVFDVYNDTATALNKARAQKITNALNQIKLNYAPQMAQQAADKGAANVAIAQSDAAYEPRMNQASLGMKNAQITATQLESAGRRLDNISKYYQAIGAPQDVQNKLKIQQAQLGLLYAKTKLAGQGGAAGQKNKPVYYDKTGAQIPAPTLPSDGAPSPDMGTPSSNANAPMLDSTPAPPAPLNSGDNTGMPPAPSSDGAPIPSAPTQASSLPNANPNMPDVLMSVGPVDSRGHAGAVRNLRTGERFTVLTPTGREKMRNQLVALRQAIPYIDDLKKYGTVGAVGPTGINELLPTAWGGVPRGVGANYDKALAAASEHVMVGSQMQKTDKTTDMINTILNRQNFESSADYINRMNAFQEHLRELETDTKNTLGMNMMSLDKSALEENYVTNEYKKIKSHDKSRPGMVYVDNGEGKKGWISEKEWNDPANKKDLANYKRLDNGD